MKTVNQRPNGTVPEDLFVRPSKGLERAVHTEGGMCLYFLLRLQSRAGKGKKVKYSRYRPGVAQRVGRGIALLFHDRGTRRG